MSDSQVHIIRTTIIISKVNLAVRFPCSLIFQLKNESNTTEGRCSYELQGGRCEPSEKISLDTEIPYRNGEYPDKKIVLIVLMESANGKIPAGSINIKISSKGKLVPSSSQETSGIDKCPDKNAKAFFSTKVQFIRSHKSFGLLDSSRPGKKNSNSRNSRSPSYLSSNDRQLKKSYTSSVSRIVSRPINYRTNRLQTHQVEVNAMDRISNDQSNPSKGENSIIYEEFDTQRSKYKINLDKERLESKRQIAQLKAELYALKKDERWQGRGQQSSRFKHQIESLNADLNAAREKNKNLERKQRQLHQQVKDLKDQTEKLKSKCLQSESVNFQMKLSVEQKQKLVKNLHEEVKSLKEQIQDQRISINMHEKRIEFKENTFKEQLQKLTEKYQQSEAERQKATFELNNMLTEFENIEKKSQLTTKDKERVFLDQKNKLNKKVEGLVSALKASQEENEDNQVYILELEASVKLSSKFKEEANQQLEQLKAKLLQEEAANRKLTVTLNQKERQIEDFLKIQADYESLKKNFADLSMEQMKTSDSLAKTNKKLTQHQTTVKTLEEQLKETQSSKDSLSLKNSQLIKQVHQLSKTLETKNNEISSLNNALGSMGSRLDESKMKLEVEKNDFEESNGKLSTDLVYLMKTKDYLENEIDQLKWKLQKSESFIENLNGKNSELNERVLKLNEELINEQEKTKNLRQNVKDLQSNIQALKNEIITKEAKEKDLHLVVKAKTQIQYSLKKALSEKQQEIYIITEKFKTLELESNDKVQTYEALLKQRDSGLAQFKKYLQQTSTELEKSKNTKQLTCKSYERLQQENNYHKEIIEQDKRKIGELQDKIQSLNSYIQALEDDRIEQNKQKEALTQKMLKSADELKALKNEWQIYKDTTFHAMQNFLHEINSSASSKNGSGKKVNTSHELIAFPDEDLSLLQIQAFKKRKEMVFNFQERIKQLQQLHSYTQTELDKLNEYLKVREQQMEKQLQFEKQRNRELSSSSLAQKNQLLENIMLAEEKNYELSSENEKLSLELKNTKDELYEMEKLFNSEKDARNLLEEELKKLAKQMEDQNKNQQFSKQSNVNEYSSMMEEKKIHIDRLNKHVRELQNRFQTQEKTNLSNETKINNLQKSLSESAHNQSKLEKKIEFEQLRYKQLQESKRSLENSLREMELKIKESSAAEQKLNKNLNTERIKVQELNIKLKKAEQEAANQQLQIGRLSTQIQILTENIVEIDAQNKKNFNRQKQSNEKATETVKQLQEKIITLTSDLELKNFLISQAENNISQYKATITDQSNELLKKKEDIQNYQYRMEDLKSQNIFMQQALESLRKEKQSLQSEYQKQKGLILDMNSEANQYSVINEVLLSKEREVDRLRDDLENAEIRYQANNKELRQTISQLRKQGGARSLKQEELRRKIRELEKEIEVKSYDLTKARKKQHEDADREKQELINQLESLEKDSLNMRNEYEYLLQQSAKEAESYNKQCEDLKALLTDKENQLDAKNKLIKDNEKKIKLLSNELRNLVESSERDGKARALPSDVDLRSSTTSLKFKKIIDEIDAKSRNLIVRSRRDNI